MGFFLSLLGSLIEFDFLFWLFAHPYFFREGRGVRFEFSFSFSLSFCLRFVCSCCCCCFFSFFFRPRASSSLLFHIAESRAPLLSTSPKNKFVSFSTTCKSRGKLCVCLFVLEHFFFVVCVLFMFCLCCCSNLACCLYLYI